MVTLVVATGLFLFLVGDGWELADQKSSVLGMAFGCAGLLLALAQWWSGRRTAPEPPDLAAAVRAQWRQEERARGVHDPYPLPVRWDNAPPELVDHWPTIHRDPDRDDPVDLSGALDDLAEVYAAVPSGRLVVLGGPGSGKTVVTTRFVLTADTERVPVILPLGSWNPEQDLRSWLSDELERQYGPEAAALVAAERVLPVLDGFDEIAPHLRDRAIRGINASLGADDPLVLTSRVAEYAAAADVVTGAAAIVLADLDAADVEKYLRLSTRGDKWAPVLDRLLPVLGTPLMTTLARTVYDTEDPAELLDVPDPEAHLLGRYVPVLYTEHRDRRHLRFLADFLVRQDTHDLAWWRLPSAVRGRRVLFAAALAAPVLLGAAVSGSTSVAVLLVVLLGPMISGLGTDHPPLRLRPTRWSGAPGAAAVGLCAGAGAGLLLGLAPWTVVLLAAAVAALAVATAVGAGPADGTVGDPDRLLRVDRTTSLVTVVKFAVPVGLAVALLGGGDGPRALTTALAIGLAQTVAYQAWGRFALARAYLAATGRLPWRLMAFLREAHRRGVLRQVGPVYQFRHARLRDRLAEEYGQTERS